MFLRIIRSKNAHTAFAQREDSVVVLKNGAVPLDILERIVDAYIESTLAT